MTVTEFVRVFSEEFFSALPREELHAHRVHFAAFHARPDRIDRDSRSVHPVRKCMAGFMGHGLDIALSAVEVGKDKRHFVIVYASAVSASLFALC